MKFVKGDTIRIHYIPKSKSNVWSRVQTILYSILTKRPRYDEPEVYEAFPWP